MSTPASPTKRRPVPPPKTDSQARLRDDLTSPSRERGDALDGPSSMNKAGHGLSEAQMRKKEAMKHLTLPPGWDLRDEVDVTYHKHVAKPVVHETIYRQTTELVEPKIQRDVHHYHHYDYIQPLEVEIPPDSYVTNAKGEVIHAPGGLTTQVGQNSYREQARQDRDYGLPETLGKANDHEKTDRDLERDRTVGPFPIEAEGGGEGVLQLIRDGGVAQRLEGPLTSSTSTTSPPSHTATPKRAQAPPLRGSFEHSSPNQQPQRGGEAHLLPSPSGNFDSSKQDSSATDASVGATSDLTATLEQEFDRISLQQRHPQAKPLPPLPDTFNRSTLLGAGVRRVSGDNKLRNRYGVDTDPASSQNQDSVNDDESTSDMK